jgi:hypothetical protein
MLKPAFWGSGIAPPVRGCKHAGRANFVHSHGYFKMHAEADGVAADSLMLSNSMAQSSSGRAQLV